MKIKSFECTKTIRNYEKKNTWMSDPWSLELSRDYGLDHTVFLK